MSYSQINLSNDWILARKVGHSAYEDVGGVRARVNSPGSTILLPDQAKVDVEEIEVLHAGPGYVDGSGTFIKSGDIVGRRALVKGLRANFDEKITVQGEELLLLRARDLIATVE